MIARLHPALRTTAALALLGAVYVTCVAIAQSSVMHAHPTALSLALLVDRTVTASAVSTILLPSAPRATSSPAPSTCWKPG